MHGQKNRAATGLENSFDLTKRPAHLRPVQVVQHHESGHHVCAFVFKRQRLRYVPPLERKIRGATMTTSSLEHRPAELDPDHVSCCTGHSCDLQGRISCPCTQVDDNVAGLDDLVGEIFQRWPASPDSRAVQHCSLILPLLDRLAVVETLD